MVSVSLPEKMNEEIKALIESGYYDNRSELVRDALRSFFARKSEMRLVSAVELYRQEKITISRAAEIAGVDFETMQSILKDEGVLERGREERKDTEELEEMIS
ncbi:MAG: UPF0175 family protein [Thermoplasmatota archaeon]